MTFSITGSCLTYTNTLGSSNAMTYSGPSAFTSWTIVTDSSLTNYKLELSTLTVADLESTNMVSNAFCVESYTITPTTIADRNYILGATMLTFTFVDFTIPVTCTDITWEYTAEIF